MESLGPDFDTLLTRGALIGLATVALWTTLVVGAIALEAVSGGRVCLAHRTGCPAAWRAWLLGVLVAGLAGLSPAHATDSPLPTAARALDGLPLPDRAVDEPRGGTGPDSVIVRTGDSLWLITRRLLPTGAPDHVVAEAVAALHAHNRGVIGPDPDLIRPGQRLGVPPDPPHDFPDPTTLLEEP